MNETNDILLVALFVFCGCFHHFDILSFRLFSSVPSLIPFFLGSLVPRGKWEIQMEQVVVSCQVSGGRRRM